MRISKTLYGIAAILVAADAATITQYFTAPTETVWQTYTIQSVYTTQTQLARVFGPPPNYGGATTSSFSSSFGPPQTSTFTSSTAEYTGALSTVGSSTASPSASPRAVSSSSTSSSPSSSTSTSISSSSSATPTSSTRSSTTTTTSSSTSEQADEPTEDIQFAIDILEAHNEVRRLHQVGDLVWNDTLYQFAKNYVNTAFDCANLQLIHSDSPYGENLAAGYVGGRSPVIDGWYGSEIGLVESWDPITYTDATGHLTQLLWRSTTQLGCARLNCTNPNDSPNWRQITLCNYYPRGNVIGRNVTSGNTYFVDNVFPAVGET